jgi:hypothetical protein
MNDYDLDELRKFANDNSAARAIFEWAANLQKDASFNTVDRISTMAEVDYYKTVEVLKWLAEREYGRFINGRRGHKSRIEWLCSRVYLGQAALGDDEVELEPYYDGRDVADEEEEGAARTTDAVYRGKRRFTYQELISALSYLSGADPDTIIVDLKIPEARRLLARAQDLPEDSVTIRIG